MACSAMANGFPLDTIFLCGEDKAEKVCPGLCGRDCGGRDSIEGLLADEELEVSEEERMAGGVGSDPAVFSWPEEEEERNPVQVADCLLAVGAALVGGIQGLEDGDGDGADSCWWGILFEVSGEFPAQPKVKLDQLGVPGDFGPHRYEYFPYGTKVLFHGTLLDGCSSGFQKVGAHALGEDIEETYGIPDVLEVGWDLHPLAELAPLAPGGGVFLEECGR